MIWDSSVVIWQNFWWYNFVICQINQIRLIESLFYQCAQAAQRATTVLVRSAQNAGQGRLFLSKIKLGTLNSP